MPELERMSVDTARAFWVVTPGRGEIRDEPIRAPRSNEVLVRAIYSGISRGTESLVFNGRVPESEYQRMRAPFQDGDFPGPVKYGYSSVGRVGDRHVFVLFPHQDRYVVPADAVHMIPDNVPPPRAVLAANLETAVNGLWDARPHVGDRVSVVGGGTVGSLVAYLAARIAGCDVQLVDVNAARAKTADALRVSFATPNKARRDADLVVHASGTEAGLQTALDLAAFEATIVDMSWYGSASVSVPLGGAFHSKRLTIQSSQVGHVAASQRARWTHSRRMALALRLLADPSLDALITGESDFESLPQTMSTLASGTGDVLCHRIRYV